MSERTMKNYLMQPLAPLVVRSGRPFDDQAGADSARFPPPSTLAGALRTAVADSRREAYSPALAGIPVAGPLPVKLDPEGRPTTLLVPKPADAMYFRTPDKQSCRLVRAAPSPFAEGEGADLETGMLPVCLVDAVRGKPAPAPQWWAIDDFLKFRSGQNVDAATIDANGWTPAHIDTRTHVAIDPVRQSAADGKLFQTSGMDFVQAKNDATLADIRPIGLLGSVDGDIASGLIPLGGERRLSAITETNASLWPEFDEGMAAAIAQAGGLVVSLLTPALFAEGWRPGWLNDALQGTPPGCEGVTLRLRAAALDRWQPHSGWDLAAKAPRAGRKVVPGGAVYWFQIIAGTGSALRPLWLGSLCDDPQDRRDGFGLSIIHPWQVPGNPGHC